MRMVRGTALVAFALVGALVTAIPAYAQQKAAFNFGSVSATPPATRQSSDQGVGIGALGGMTITSARGEGSEGTSAGTGWMFGIWFGGNRNGRVGFMGELSYVQKKIQAEIDPEDNYLTTNYLEIPALVRINIGSEMREGLSVYGLVGPVFDIRLSSKLVDFGFEVPEEELENDFSGVDIGIMAGAGVEWNRIGFEVRGNWGLKRLATDEAIDAGRFPPTKNTSIQILGKFRFN